MNVAMKLFFSFALVLTCGLAHAQDVHGVLRVVKGDVKIKSAKTGDTVRARLGMQVYPKDVILTAKDSRAKIVMVDNNEINVAPDSQIEIQHYEYDPAKNKKDVLLNVIYGKVRSKVEQHYDGKTSKYEVKTPSAVAGVRGTDFIASYNPTNNSSQIVTFRGAVEFGTPGPGGIIANSVRVTPGKMATSVAGSAPSAPTVLPKDQLAKMDQESKPESASSPSAGERAPSSDHDQHEKGDKAPGNSGDDHSGGKAATPPGPNASADDEGGKGSRAPASAGGDQSSGSKPMMLPQDLPANTPPLPPPVPMANGPIGMPQPGQPIISPVTCPNCTSLLQGTQTHVTVHLSNGGTAP